MLFASILSFCRSILLLVHLTCFSEAERRRLPSCLERTMTKK